MLGAWTQDVYIGAAAVAEYMPQRTSEHKSKKSAAMLVLELVRTPDILAEVARDPKRPRLVVGFAAETQALEANARAKRDAKHVDSIAANQVGVAGSGFEFDTNTLSVFWNDGSTQLGPASKIEVARELLALIAAQLKPS